jgi:hypothetical protein
MGARFDRVRANSSFFDSPAGFAGNTMVVVLRVRYTRSLAPATSSGLAFSVVIRSVSISRRGLAQIRQRCRI